MFGEDVLTIIAQLVPFVVGMTEVLKKIIPSKFMPLISLLLGIAGGFFYVPGIDIKQKVLAGLIIGLTSTGSYSGIKNTAQGLKTNRTKKSVPIKKKTRRYIEEEDE